MIGNRPEILLAMSSDREQGKWRTIKADKCYPMAMKNAGGIPVINAECGLAEEMAARYDALLLSGGPDVSPSVYGEEPRFDTVKTDPVRDAEEAALIRAFMALKKPILGICRGSQILNTVLGGTLWQDLPEELGVRHAPEVMLPDLYWVHHEAAAEPGSLLAEIFGERFMINSAHHQAVKTPAPGFKVTCRSAADGIVEGMEHETLPILTVQFHPEILTGAFNDGATPDFLPLFEAFVRMSAEDAAKRG